jgi:DNA repair protein RadA/Sms
VALPVSRRQASAAQCAWHADDMPRLPLRIAELNRVLGGGIVPGSCVLVGGDPGIGKSTLLLADGGGCGAGTGTVLYVSAEESAHQIGRRAARLGIHDERLLVLRDRRRVDCRADRSDAPGAGDRRFGAGDLFGQRRQRRGHGQPGARLRGRAVARGKAQNVPVFLVGHVTKEGPSPARACWSTWWTPCCNWRASAFTPSACCVRSRTASAAPTKSASSR